MYCTQCGAELREGASFCGKCGAAVQPPVQPAEGKRKNAGAGKWLLVGGALLLLLAIGVWQYFTSDAYYCRKANGLLEWDNTRAAEEVLRKVNSEAAGELIRYLECREAVLEEEDPEEAVAATGAFLRAYEQFRWKEDLAGGAQLERDAELYAKALQVDALWQEYLELEADVPELVDSVFEDVRICGYDPATEEHGPYFTAAEEQEKMQRWSRMRERVWDFLNAAEYGSEFLYLRELVVDSENYTEEVDEIIADVLELYGPEERVYYTGTSYGRAYSPYLADNVEIYPDMVREQIARSLAHRLQRPRVIGTGRSALRHPDGEVWLTYQVLVDRTVEITGMEPDYAMVKRIEIPEQVHWEEGGVDCPVSGIAEEAFFGNETLQSIHLPDSIRRIGRAAFSDCPALTEVTLPDGWSYVSIAAFDGSPELELVCSEESYERLEEVGFVYGRYCVDGSSMLHQQHW